MLSPTTLQKRYGVPAGPKEGSYMAIWKVPADILAAFAHVKFSALGTTGFPERIYCHQLMAPRLELALRALMAKKLTKELHTWDGCYMVRNMRGLKSWSLHAWGAAVDVNAAENRLGQKPVLSAAFVSCFTTAGLDWGGPWSRPDGMHFQLRSL